MPQGRIDIKDVSAVTPSLRPRLKVQAQFHPPRRRFTLHQSKAEMYLNKDQKVYLTQIEVDNIGEKFSQNNPSQLHFFGDLTREALEKIEEQRGGNDLKFAIEGVLRGENSSDELMNFQIGVEGRIPQSDWADILDTFEYGDIRLIELRFPEAPEKEDIEEAWNHVQDADQDFARGNWEDCITDARKAINVIDRLDREQKLDSILGDEKWNRMLDMMSGLNAFLDLGTHSEEQIGHKPMKRRDAEASLLMTKALVIFVADGIREGQK